MVNVLTMISLLPAILAGEYNAQTLSAAEQDSVLNQGAEQTQRYRLEYENEQRIFRHSAVADWYIIDTQKNNQRTALGSDLGPVRDAIMSPNGKYVAFAKDNNIYIHKLDFGTEVAATHDEDPDIINGVADWLYEEEFGTTAIMAWSPDSKQLAFVRLDEHEVPSFSWQTYLDPAAYADKSTSVDYPQYPAADTLRYPKAGCTNARASVCVYDVPTKAIRTMQVNNENDDVYFPRLKWTEQGLFVLKLNRDQNKMEVLNCNAKSTIAHPLYSESSQTYYIEYELFDQWQWLSDGRIVCLSEKDGWRRAYLLNSQGMELKVLTPDSIDVTALYTVDEKSQTLYYQAAPTPSTRQIYAVNMKKNQVVQLTSEEGTHSARFSADNKKMIDCFQSFTTPNTYSLYTIKGLNAEFVRVILDHTNGKVLWNDYGFKEQLFQIPNSNGQLLEAMLILPPEANDSLQKGDHLVQKSETPYPLVLMHYSGPQSQRVLNRWRKRFEYALAQAGYAVLIVDVRGGDCKGRAWRNETYMNLGVKEAEDLAAAARFVGKRDDIDSTRMAILGWSYGGYQTLYTMSTKNHPFKAGIAIAPVTDWELYDTGYTERFMRRPQVNADGYQTASLLNKAVDLTGNVLIIHGTADDNVHVQHTMQYIDALVRANKQFEMQLYPDDNHHMRRGNNALHMHERILLFLKNNL